MDLVTLATIGKEVGLPMVAMIGVMYILYQVILNLRKEHEENQTWFKDFVNENNHKVTDLVSEVSKNIAMNTASNEKFVQVLENHTKAIEKCVNK